MKIDDKLVRISDLVWCKDMGQPWWPGKVIGDSMMVTDSDDESLESDVYLVVCFGDRSTAWHGVSCVKPFWENFPRLAKQSDIGCFRKAVDCAIEEVSRRVKYTLTCRCLPKQIHVDVGRPFWGVDCKDKREDVLSTVSFVPREVIDYLRASSVAASVGHDRLVLEVRIAQLSAFFIWRNAIGTGSFPSRHNTSSIRGYAAYVNEVQGKFPAGTNDSGDISSTAIPMENLGECVGDSEEKNYATSLHMTFTDWNSVPLAADLHETFGRFGELIESETKLYPKSTTARIVFKERMAAESAFGSVRESLPSVVSFKLKLMHLKPGKSSRGRKRQRWNIATPPDA